MRAANSSAAPSGSEQASDSPLGFDLGCVEAEKLLELPPEVNPLSYKCCLLFDMFDTDNLTRRWRSTPESDGATKAKPAAVLAVATIGTMLPGASPRPLFDFAEVSARTLGVVGMAATQIR